MLAGYLFESSPLRLCNAYLLDDQVRLGQRLVWLAAAIGLAWFAGIVRTLVRKEAATGLPMPMPVNENASTAKSAAR